MEKETSSDRPIKPDPVEQFALRRVPYVGPLIAELRQLRYDLQAERFADVLEEALPQDHAVEFLERIRSDERLSDLFMDAVQRATASSEERKRRALGRVVRSSVEASDDAAIEEAGLLLAALGQLETPHIRVMMLIHSPPELVGTLKISPGTPLHAGKVHEFYPTAGLALDSILAQLEAWGILKDVSHPGALGDEGPKWIVSAYGERLLKYLEEEPEESATH